MSGTEGKWRRVVVHSHASKAETSELAHHLTQAVVRTRVGWTVAMDVASSRVGEILGSDSSTSVHCGG